MAFKQPRRRKGKGTTLHASTVSQPSKNQHLQPKKSNPPSKRGPGFMTGRKRGYRSGDYLDHRAVSSQSQRQSGFGTRGGIAIMQSNRNKNQRNSSSSIDINPLEMVEDQRRQQLHNFGVPNDSPPKSATRSKTQNEPDFQEEWRHVNSNETVELKDYDYEEDNANEYYANAIIKNLNRNRTDFQEEWRHAKSNETIELEDSDFDSGEDNASDFANRVIKSLNRNRTGFQEGWRHAKSKETIDLEDSDFDSGEDNASDFANRVIKSLNRNRTSFQEGWRHVGSNKTIELEDSDEDDSNDASGEFANKIINI